MTEISRNCIHLQSLNINGCNNITDISMTEISRNCIHLKSLDTSGCYRITATTKKLSALLLLKGHIYSVT